MTSRAQLRKTAMSLPETVEQDAGARAIAFAVDDTRFAIATADGLVELLLTPSDAEEVLAAHPTAARWARAATPVGVRIRLADINGQQLNHWVRRAWLSAAPTRLAARAAEADRAAPGAVGDLPKAIGGPATRALVSAGVTTLDQVAAMGRAELSALHGVGPKAVRILDETLAATGRTLA